MQSPSIQKNRTLFGSVTLADASSDSKFGTKHRLTNLNKKLPRNCKIFNCACAEVTKHKLQFPQYLTRTLSYVAD